MLELMIAGIQLKCLSKMIGIIKKNNTVFEVTILNVIKQVKKYF